ncbi:hypothetical protein [Nodosilinea sp. P-1105]|uniref:hypothetical protein n=1 Tax=Nodosilinea sp. P-1105 TaxID=2546229 RepID=UPI00146BF5B3|nr:hypothetical protein [Nodosilinea sp. P-1105]NMF81925.1 hypothetical protein [Nodosilinea sp. P-1105]
MDWQEFETSYREQTRDILNRLQSTMLVSSQLEAALAEIHESVQSLTRDVEAFLAEQRPDANSENGV